MLEKPKLADERIIAQLQDEYGLRVVAFCFLPLGADMGTAVYRVTTDDKKAYFLKLRKGFNEIVVTVPLFLASQGIEEIIAPLQTKSKKGWADFGDYRMILYPFIDGKNGFEIEISDHQKRTMGRSLQAIHSTTIPPALKTLIPQETFSPGYRECMKTFLQQAEHPTFYEPVAMKLALFMKTKRAHITHIIERAEVLALDLESKPLEFVLCHTDLHGGNILIGDTGELYIVDWDAPLLAPKERDLMFIGGGIDEIWKDPHDEALFYEGYGKTHVNLTALAYYRYQRIIVDMVEICQQLLVTDEGGADREQAYRWFIANFAPGQAIDCAEKTLAFDA